MIELASRAPHGSALLSVVLIVAVFAIVQSVFGVGLLLFGTPTLLLLGFPFDVVLVYLLPCSIAVSALQLATSGGLTLEPIRRQFLAITVPSVLAASAVALTVGSPHAIRTVVGMVLLATALTRVGRLNQKLKGVVRRHRRPMMFGLGIIHGLSNLGGGLLTVIVSSSFDDKVSIRRHIAFAYGAMAIIQLSVVLIVAHPHVDVRLVLTLPVISATAFLLIGQRAFQRAQYRTYQVGLTGMIASFGLLLLGTA